MVFNSANPASGILAKQLDDDCRTNFEALLATVAYGHEFLDNSANQSGEHAEGSAKIFGRTTAPTTKEDGSAVLDSDDDNRRLWMDTTADQLKICTDGDTPTWENVAEHLGMQTDDTMAAVTDELAVSGLAVKTYVDTNLDLHLDLAGIGVMTGPLDMGGKKIVGVVDPTAASQEAATAAYAEAVGLASQFKVGTYTGNAGTQIIGSLGFLPNFVMIIPLETTRDTYIKTVDMATTLAKNITDGSSSTDSITAFASGSFTVSDAGSGKTKMNESGEGYYYIAAILGT